MNEVYLDKNIIHDVRYWLCLSLARRKDRRVLREVQKLDDADHNFIVGFYYRIIGKPKYAIERFNKVLTERPGYFRAKSELVQVYLNVEDYDNALQLAKENYYTDKNNPYNLRSYFKCLMLVEGKKAKVELQNLLDGFEMSPHEKAKEMHLNSTAEFYFYIEGNIEKALETIDESISIYPKKIYPYITKLQLLKKANAYEDISKTINSIDKSFYGESDIFSSLTYLCGKCIQLVRKGEEVAARELLDKKIRPIATEKVYANLKLDLFNR